MQVSFKAASFEDVDELMAVQNAAFDHDLKRYGECPAIMKDRQMMIERISRSIFYKIVADGRIVGTIQVNVRNERHYNLTVLGIHPDYDNKGIGTQAIQYLLDTYPEVDLWTLITPKDNPHSRHLYEKMGFVNAGEEEVPGVLTLICYHRLADGLSGE